ncbi:MAG: hypothetical protein U0946_01600, partial [Patescibacteria group bacterium]|nr:hypothetical protein [Patescibacteria group bacterium]
SIEIEAKIENQDIIRSSTLYYQRGSESGWEEIPMASKEGGLYQATIPGESITGNRVKYYIGVVDKFGNHTDSKNEVGEPFVIEIEKVNIGWPDLSSWHKKWYVWALIVVGVVITGIAISSSGGGDGGTGGGTGGGAGG